MSSLIQEQFIGFHDKIRLNLDDNKEVIEKRDMLIDEISAYLKKMCDEKKIKLIQFSVFNQGSYAMGTGNKPAYDEDDYDIDCGLLFAIDKENYTPIEVKQWVFDALNITFREVQWKKACIRVQYVEEGLPRFHVDFACYSDDKEDGKIYLAKGTPTTLPQNRKWEEAEPQKLKNLINNRFSNAKESAQFKRVIRYLKRWKDYQFDSVNGKPTGISFTALAYNGFTPYTKDIFSSAENVDDLKATLEFVKYVLGQFNIWTGRIAVSLPVLPGNDLFEKMTDQQCINFKEKLGKLKVSIENAQAEVDPHEACKFLRKQFGDDFPLPPKIATGQTRVKGVAGTSESA